MQVNFQIQHFVDKAVIAEDANKGILQMVNPSGDALTVIAHRGFDAEVLAALGTIRAFDPCACGRAFGIKNTVIIDDVEQDASFKPFLGFARRCGFRAIKSVPIINTAEQCIGVITMHYMKPYTVNNNDALRAILPDLVKLIERKGSVEFSA
jgi:hypothetical protein